MLALHHPTIQIQPDLISLTRGLSYTPYGEVLTG